MRAFRYTILGLIIILASSLDVYSQGADCAAATALTINASPCASGTAGDNTINDAASPSCLGANTITRDSWYKYTVTTGPQTIIIDVTNSNRDILVQVFSGACGSLTEIGCTNSISGTGTESLTITNQASGTYLIRMVSLNNATSLSSICVSTPAAGPANDNCSGAITLSPGAAGDACSPTSGTLASATQSQAGCAGTADDDVWYKFVATATSHTVTVDPGTSTDPVMQIFS